MFWKEDHVVGTFKNMCTVAVHSWYIKMQDFANKFLKKKKKIFFFSGDILVDGYFEFKVYLEKFVPSPEMQKFHVIPGSNSSWYADQSS